jgi:hypothetical protein
LLVIPVYGTRFPMGLLSSLLTIAARVPFGHGSIVMHHSLVYGPAVQIGRQVLLTFCLIIVMAWCDEEYAIALMLYIRNPCLLFLY